MKNVLILIIILSFISCSNTTPSGFWLNYQKKLITEKQNDQGPFGGKLAVNWVAEKGSNFDIKKITEFADENDWKLIDSTTYKKTEMVNMTDLGKPAINLPLKNYKSEFLPRWIKTDCTLYRFKTGWLIFKSGTDDSTNENGFILISSDNKQMTAYHLWGE